MNEMNCVFDGPQCSDRDLNDDEKKVMYLSACVKECLNSSSRNLVNFLLCHLFGYVQ